MNDRPQLLLLDPSLLALQVGDNNIVHALMSMIGVLYEKPGTTKLVISMPRSQYVRLWGALKSQGQHGLTPPVTRAGDVWPGGVAGAWMACTVVVLPDAMLTHVVVARMPGPPVLVGLPDAA